MKWMLLIIPFFFSGCLYFNDRGVSTHLYNKCHESYDARGDYHEECDPNLVDYDEVKGWFEFTKDP
ncbi:MAG: hypothetical protein B6D59_01010 [Campylobacteraceae bacterium 4484_4]|nr:MAG: hypothetical protein B6D59_01010 [Campylobacteraceae bacterium 4484_4]